MSKKERERLHIREDLVSRQAEVHCFVDEMNSFYQVSMAIARSKVFFLNTGNVEADGLDDDRKG